MQDPVSRIQNFPASQLPAGNSVLVAYEPVKGPYANRHFVIRYIPPDKITADIVDELTSSSQKEVFGLPGKALYSAIVEVLPNGTRDVPKISQEFTDIFTAAILNGEGTVGIDKDGSLVDLLDL
jgi:hypothetical protein